MQILIDGKVRTISTAIVIEERFHICAAMKITGCQEFVSDAKHSPRGCCGGCYAVLAEIAKGRPEVWAKFESQGVRHKKRQKHKRALAVINGQDPGKEKPRHGRQRD
jgi:hypothetical protein